MWFAGPARRVPAAGRPRVLRLGYDLKPGMRVGLFGGSFNPAHEGHAHVAETLQHLLHCAQQSMQASLHAGGNHVTEAKGE